MSAALTRNLQDKTSELTEDGFDKDDIAYLTGHLTEAELREELHHAEIEVGVARGAGEDDDLAYWQWYSGLCREALNTLRSNRPKPVMGNGGISVKAVKGIHDVVDVIGRYVQLRKVGRDQYSGLCPFHKEKHPSFGVNTELQRWHCFGCDRSGDVIDFVAQIEGISIKETCLKLGT